jgi:copper(I)-binding protein
MTPLFVVVALATLGTPPPSSPSSASAPPPSTAAAGCAALAVNDAWIRLVPPGAKNTAAFLQVTNRGSTAVAIVGAGSAVARRAELHTHRHEGGVMKMLAVPSVPIAAGATVAFAPGALHVMLFEQTGVKAGERHPLTLRCDDGGSVVVEGVVSSSAPKPPAP